MLLAPLVLWAALGSGIPLPAEDTAGTTKPLPPEARILTDLNFFLELHNELMVSAARGAPAAADFTGFESEVEAYSLAFELAQGGKVWQIVNDTCARSLDISTLQRLGAELPDDLPAADREAARKVFDALVSAWPRFDSQIRLKRLRGLTRVLTLVVRRHFSGKNEERILSMLYDKMSFKTLDAPITVYLVTDSHGVGAWGKTEAGYYLVIPALSQTTAAIVESIVHEATHLIEARQPDGRKSTLMKLKTGGANSDPAVVDTFLHGLIAWNAGELVRRVLQETHRPIVETSSTWKNSVGAFLPVYREAWGGYLDGRLTEEETLQKLSAVLSRAAPQALPAPRR